MNKTNLVFMGMSIDALINEHKPTDYYSFLEGVGGCYAIGAPSKLDFVALMNDNKDLFSEIFETCTEHLSPREVNFDIFVNTLFVNLLCKFVDFHRDEIENCIIRDYSPTLQAMKYALPNIKVTQHSDSVFFDEKGNKYLVFTQEKCEELKRDKLINDLHDSCPKDVILCLNVDEYLTKQLSKTSMESLHKGLTRIKSIYIKETYIVFMCKHDYNF